ncbi:3-deoxy-D-manno-octulosonic-acid transferase [Mucilaginibacter lappiensis]|uniref:3-deoxy-D-manno-octulosonic acid transferase n=1 Tax=Mucilaginibacter lappiensis TaxID=354630 RepID=A0ABR6PED2_9SPHI|nr:glycosyltransferase N-terminal domain-containing protein [Mucilaginibacter lappiensis]MBB6108114.1 3-deoxy-D-manno-octulosonic-acid transferase [Mucilaginibacter lappiensis]SIS11478.1 3-deoxy-D-manno-octulosonic-acid transferase [Mucilaginibacter lappiensis]
MFLYNIGIKLYYFIVWLASFFDTKAGLWINGRRQQKLAHFDSSIWFHFASLGEFEQGRPILEAMRGQYPGKSIVVTFFSPSGYEIRKNTPLADAVYYLPLDTKNNARDFIDTIKPDMAIFTKYEYWYHYFNELHKQSVPLYIVSGIFRPGQVFFKWYGGLHRKMLSFVMHFFLQDESSKQLLNNLGITNVTVSGDTRFDRVWANAQNPKEIAGISEFKNGQKLFIAGSTWPEDEKLLATLPALYPDWKFIFAPHEIEEDRVNHLINLLPKGSAVKYSEWVENSKFKIQNSKDGSNLISHISHLTSLVIDNIGMLSSLYAYGDIAYIGGGFGAGIHNTLEAAAFGLPVIFGPKYLKFNEARELIALKAGFSISDETQLKGIVDTLITDEAFYSTTSKKIYNYVQEHTGATKMIMSHIDMQMCRL